MTIEDLEGGPALCAWFGHTPSFHDATLQELVLRQNGPSRLVARTFHMTTELDERGFLVLAKHVVVTLTLHGPLRVDLREFMDAGIMMGLDVTATPNGVELEFGSSYGVYGQIEARRVVVIFEPLPD